MVEFIKQKYNADINYWGFLIEMFTEGPPHEPFFIALTLWEILVIEPTKKLVATYVVGDLAFLNWKVHRDINIKVGVLLQSHNQWPYARHVLELVLFIDSFPILSQIFV